MPPAGFEPAIPAGERPQTQALETRSTHIKLNIIDLLCLMENYNLLSVN